MANCAHVNGMDEELFKKLEYIYTNCHEETVPNNHEQNKLSLFYSWINVCETVN